MTLLDIGRQFGSIESRPSNFRELILGFHCYAEFLTDLQGVLFPSGGKAAVVSDHIYMEVISESRTRRCGMRSVLLRGKMMTPCARGFPFKIELTELCTA
jgi:hypothetical protein